MPLFVLYVRDQARSRAFYAEILQASPTLDVPGMTQFDLGGAQLGLMPEAGIERLLPVRPSTSQVPRAELYLPVEDVEAAYRRAVGAGATALSEPAARDWGDVAAYVADPDGHVVAFARGA